MPGNPVQHVALERTRHTRMIEIIIWVIRHAQSLHHPPRPLILTSSERDDLRHPECAEGRCQCRTGPLGGEPRPSIRGHNHGLAVW